MVGRAVVLSFALLLVVGCAVGSIGCAQGNKNLTLFVAAGLKPAMDPVVQQFQAEKGVKVTTNYGSTGGLYAQIKAGQPCDLYYVADWMYVDMLNKDGKLAEGKKFLKDQEVLLVSKKGEGKVKSVQDLAKPGVTFVIADPQAPAGAYAEAALKKLGIWDQV